MSQGWSNTIVDTAMTTTPKTSHPRRKRRVDSAGSGRFLHKCDSVSARARAEIRGGDGEPGGPRARSTRPPGRTGALACAIHERAGQAPLDPGRTRARWAPRGRDCRCAALPCRLLLGGGRLPRRVHLLHALRLPHRLAADPGTAVHGSDPTARVLGATIPPPHAGRALCPRADRPLRSARGHTGAGPGLARRRARFSGLCRQLAVPVLGTVLRPAVLQPVTCRALLELVHRRAVLSRLPVADVRRARRGPRVAPSARSRVRRLG